MRKEKILDKFGFMSDTLLKDTIIILHNDMEINVNTSGSKFWFKHNSLHREDGPAAMWNDGYKVWYLNGKDYSEENWRKQIENQRK